MICSNGECGEQSGHGGICGESVEVVAIVSSVVFVASVASVVSVEGVTAVVAQKGVYNNVVSRNMS